MQNALAKLNQADNNRKLKAKKATEAICKSFADHENIKTISENNMERNVTAINSHLPKVNF